MSDWHTFDAPAKLNLTLVVGRRRPEGMHELVTVMERLTLADTIHVRRSNGTSVHGFDDDTLVRAALDQMTQRTSADSGFEVRIDKRIPVAAGLGGGSSDAAAALRLANDLLETPLPTDELDSIAAWLGADVPFFLRPGPQLATGDGTSLEPTAVPRDYSVVLALPHGAVKASTADVYAAFDARRGHVGFDERRAGLLHALEECAGVDDLARLPANDLASSPLTARLRDLGAIRADVTGAGPVVYGLFAEAGDAADAANAIGDRAATWVARPA